MTRREKQLASALRKLIKASHGMNSSVSLGFKQMDNRGVDALDEAYTELMDAASAAEKVLKRGEGAQAQASRLTTTTHQLQTPTKENHHD